ncbi:CAAD domain-containing protein [Pseudanabaena sp. FACHB-1277]|jgi:hypothetical protein|uniref:CAAD domain-containing protein n=1 Tax=Pseudanabaena cinerea FACHB-1277 TaxID=2949581 RepID=A0A926URA1_9CYAN|nr:CAAD domain-containing protein [Pseudanabaena cinerea]MBD2149393.1 CAAD domain-containing protein [Pseudanabaena cinerea FACHB-1277]
MDIKPTTVETTAKNVVDTVEVEKISKSVVAAEGISSLSSPTSLNIPEPAAIDNTPTSTNEAMPLSSKIEILEQIAQLWQQYFGEGKKSNLILAIILIATIPLLATVSSLLDFLNKIPLLPSLFELVGFGYSVWFVYRYLLFAHTRKEITDAIANWKQQIVG